VPNYKELMAVNWVLSIFTGGIGGLIYGLTSTGVHGDVKFQAVLSDIKGGGIVFDKTYSGHYEEKKKKIICDSPKTKAYITGKALKIGIEQLKNDLLKVIKFY
jgi:hypothetical protein